MKLNFLIGSSSNSRISLYYIYTSDETAALHNIYILLQSYEVILLIYSRIESFRNVDATAAASTPISSDGLSYLALNIFFKDILKADW